MNIVMQIKYAPEHTTNDSVTLFYMCLYNFLFLLSFDLNRSRTEQSNLLLKKSNILRVSQIYLDATFGYCQCWCAVAICIIQRILFHTLLTFYLSFVCSYQRHQKKCFKYESK